MNLPRRSLTAAATRVTTATEQKIVQAQAGWQTRALNYYDRVGEIHYAAQFYAKGLSRVRFFPALLDDEGEPQEITDGPILPLWERMQDPGGGRSQMQAQYGRLAFLIGECYLLVSTAQAGNDGWETTEEERWEIVSKDELIIGAGGRVTKRMYAPGLTAEELQLIPGGDPKAEWFKPLPGEAIAYRLWIPHPRFSAIADSPMRGVLDVCVARGSMVSTPLGARRIEDVRPGDEVWAWRDGKMISRTVTAARSTGQNDTVRVIAGRRVIRCTPEHRVLVARRDRPGVGHDAVVTTEWVRAEELQAGDALVVADRIPSQSGGWTLPDGTPGSADVAYFLGQVCGDGHVSKYTVKVSTFNKDRDAELARIVLETWGLESRRRGTHEIAWHSVDLVRLLALVGLKCKAPEKIVPPIVWQMPDEHKRAFLRGYEEADGHLTPQGWQSHATSSERLAYELRHLYIELGENVSNPHVEERPREGMYIAGHQRLTTSALPLHRFQVYYGSRRRGAKRLLKTVRQREVIGESFTLAIVKRVEIAGETETFDLTVPGADCFIADGVVAHNCEELVSLTQAVRARVRSRLAAAGVLFLAEEMGLPPLEPTADENVMNDPLIRDLTNAATAAIKDEGSAAAVVPIIMRVKGEYLKEGVGYSHLKIHDPKDTYPETGLRNEAIRRLALGLDMPPEVLLGTADVNHWGAWMIDEQVWKSHLHPIAIGYAGDVAMTYLRPAAKDDGFPDWAKVVIGIDASSVVNHPDRAADAKDLQDRCVISDAALREAAGFGEEDVPTEQEVWRWIGVRTHDSSLALYGVPMLRDQPSGAPSAVPPETPSGTPPADETGGGVTPGPPAAAKTLAVLLQGMGEVAVERCRELAGAKIRSSTTKCKSKACVECASMIDGVTNAKVASVLGFERADGLAVPPAPALVSGGADLFVQTARRFGCPDDFASFLGEMIESHAAHSLYDARCPRLPSGFIGLLQRGQA